MLVLVLVFKDSLRTITKSLSLSLFWSKSPLIFHCFGGPRSTKVHLLWTSKAQKPDAAASVVRHSIVTTLILVLWRTFCDAAYRQNCSTILLYRWCIIKRFHQDTFGNGCESRTRFRRNRNEETFNSFSASQVEITSASQSVTLDKIPTPFVFSVFPLPFSDLLRGCDGITLDNRFTNMASALRKHKH